MTIDDDFGPDLIHTVTWREFLSDDEYGQPTYGAPQVFQSRTDFTRVNFTNARGQSVEARGEAWFAPLSVPFSVDMTITERLARSEYTIHTGEVVQVLDVAVIDDDRLPYATRLIFG